jgi:DNA-binding CsgD family transcriptional regulator
MLVVSFAVAEAPNAKTARHTELTGAEADLLARLLQGASNRDIAAARGTSVRTVASQLASLYRKLGVRGRTELLAMTA